MKLAVGIPNVRDYGDPRLLMDLARRAEQAGWDGFFVWDQLVYHHRGDAVVDPWVVASAVGATTERRHFTVDETVFVPTPVQQPLPIWVGGRWPNRAPFRRAARWDGVFPTHREVGHTGTMSPQQLREILDYTLSHREGSGPFDVVMEARRALAVVGNLKFTVHLDAVLERIESIVADDAEMASRARGIAGAIREATGYRWVGVYRVGRGEVEILGWSGGGPPAYATFPVTEGLTSSAVTTGRTVVSNDTRNDPRYLTAFSSTRSEIIVPILHPRTQAVVGTIDVESDRTNAFDDEDRQALERCARAMAALYVE